MQARSRTLFVTVVVLTLAAIVGMRGHAQANVPGSPALSGRYLALIVLDGFRPDYMKLAHMPNLKALIAAGMTYNRAWVGQLETETPTGHATIVTGVYPKKHGVIGFGWRAPNGAFNWMPTDLRQLRVGAMEKLIEAGGAPTLSDLMHHAYPGSKAVSLSGEKYYAADAMGTGADYILYGRGLAHGIQLLPIGAHDAPPATHYQNLDTRQDAYPWVQDALVGRVAARMVSTVTPRTLLVNLPGSDIEGHLTGGIIDPLDMRKVAEQADAAIGTIVNAYKKARLYSRTLFVVTADHGMVPNSHIVPIKGIYAGVRATGAPSLEDDLLTTGGYIFLRNPNDAARVAAGMAARHFPGVEGALYRTSGSADAGFAAEPSTQKALGPALTTAYVDLANTLASQAGPEVVLPYREDTMGLTVHGSGPHWGNHGGLSWRTQHIPLILSGPGIRHGTSWFPAELVDIAPTVERDMGLPIPSAVDGVVLADALHDAGAGDVAQQRSLGGPRSRDVRALMQHSRLEHAIALGL